MRMKARSRSVWIIGAVAICLVVVLVVLTQHTNRSAQGPILLPTSTTSGSPTATSSTKQAVGQSPEPTFAAPERWWVSPGGGVGTAIDVENPESSAKGLKPDKRAYCQMLSSTLSSGHNPLGSSGATTEDVRIATRAWLAELEALSSGNVRAAWQVFGPALLAALAPSPARQSANPTVTNAITTIVAEAKATCNLDLSTTTS